MQVTYGEVESIIDGVKEQQRQRGGHTSADESFWSWVKILARPSLPLEFQLPLDVILRGKEAIQRWSLEKLPKLEAYIETQRHGKAV